MYGFPTQTTQETIDSLEIVRQLFEAGLIQSGFWHQFALTAHSPIGLNPTLYKVKIENKNPGTFANNDLIHKDSTGANHELFSAGLKKSLFNYMHGIGFEIQLSDWFEFKTSKTTISPNYIKQVIGNQNFEPVRPNNKIVWLGGIPSIRYFTKRKKNQIFEMAELTFVNRKTNLVLEMKKIDALWMYEQFVNNLINNTLKITFGELEKSFELQTGNDFVLFWNSPVMMQLRKNGLLML